MLRVYHFVLDHRIGGPHIYVDMLRKALSSRVKSFLVTTNRGSMTDIALVNFRHYWPPLYILEGLLNCFLLLMMVMFGRIPRKKTIFNIHGASNIFPVIVARLVGVPVVWSFHETSHEFKFLAEIGLRVLKGYPHILTVVANKSADVYGLKGAEFVPVAVDEEFWSLEKVNEADRIRCGWGRERDDSLTLLVVGNLNPLKGIDVLLEALKKLDGKFHLKIVGAELSTHREYACELRRQVNEILVQKPGSVIEFLGWADKRDVRALLATCDVFVLPSRSEACPTVLLEAMAMGCLCIASDVGDVRVMLSGYAYGKVFTSEDSDALTDCLRSFRCGADVLTRQAGIVYRLEDTSGKMLTLYNRLLASK